MDDLLDLSFSSPPKITAQPPPRPGPNQSAFDLLSKSSASASGSGSGANYYSSTPTLTPTPRNATPSLVPPRAYGGAASPNTAPLQSAARLGVPERPSSGSSVRTGSTSHGQQGGAQGGKGAGAADAFEDLLSLGGGSKRGPELSMADRQRRAEEERREKEEGERRMFDFDGHGLAGLGGYGAGNGAASGAPANGSSAAGLDDFLGSARPGASKSPAPILAPTPQHPPSKPLMGLSGKSKGTFWDNDFLGQASGSASQKTSAENGTAAAGMSPVARVGSSVAPSSSVVDPFDSDSLAAATPPLTAPAKSNGNGSSLGGAKGHAASALGWDDEDDDGLNELLGSRGGGNSSNSRAAQEYGDSDDDFLGELGKPVKEHQAETRDAPHRAPQAAKGQSGRAVSPPPHIIGQIVEMGFSPAQARSALAGTSDWMDVQAALESLLGGGSTSGSNGRSEDRRAEHESRDDELDFDEDAVERERARREQSERERRRARRAGPSRDSVQPRSRDEREREREPPRGGTPGQDYRDEAEKYLQQASVIGASVLGKASNLWAAGKERAQKLYEEQRKAYEAQQREQRTGGGAVGGVAGRQVDTGMREDGRPRWMVQGEEYAPGPGEEVQGGFRDGDEEEDEVSSRDVRRGTRSREQERVPARKEENADAYRSVKDRADLLFAEEPRPYVSAHRRKVVSRETVSSGTNSPAPRPAPSPKPTPVVLIQRSLVTAAPAALQAAAKGKIAGNDHFKLGRFAESETAYSGAISRLPEGHLQLVLLYNNRATVRLKLGHAEGAVQDCSAVIGLVGDYHPAREAPLPSGEEHEGVKLGEGLVKAHMRRAQGWEMRERWDEAGRDWERVMGLIMAGVGGDAGMRGMAVEGARRARKMARGGDKGQSGPAPSAPAVAPKAVPRSAPKPPPSASMTTENSAAVSSMRAAANVAEREGQEQARLKDGVDARLAAWRTGKETNLRALIASLDTVLWSEVMRLPGMKVGMHQLIGDKQVKVGYMKVVARLHPDKLSAGDTTVEQRMLANGVFGTLSEAWQAFQNGS